MKEHYLNYYARLIAEVGLNVQKGQECIVVSDIEQPQFIEILVEQIYKRGASKVRVDFISQRLRKLDYSYCSLEALSNFKDWEIEEWKWKAESLPAVCYIVSDDPDGLDGVDQEKLTKSKINKYKIIKPFRDKMESRYQWCIAAVAGEAWAKKLFPNEPSSVAIAKLWDLIFSASRIDSNAVSNWKVHNQSLKERCEFLNSQNLVSLKYTSSNGTDLTVGLNRLGRFVGGAEKTLSGIQFNPNIPTEEIFISPKAGDCEGIVYSSKPLCYDGQLIDNFSIRFEKGRAVEVKAERNPELLEKIIKMDEGAAKLGECALVGFDNAINKTGMLFYETLFDENACCHLALGRGFSETLAGYEKMSLEERHNNGINDSIIHVDFMIGTEDLRIVGIKACGERIDIFTNGNWVVAKKDE